LPNISSIAAENPKIIRELTVKIYFDRLTPLAPPPNISVKLGRRTVCFKSDHEGQPCDYAMALTIMGSFILALLGNDHRR
jgi:hypothetical protein